MTFHAYTPVHNNIVVHTLCIWGHRYSTYENVPENLTFLGAGEGGWG